MKKTSKSIYETPMTFVGIIVALVFSYLIITSPRWHPVENTSFSYGPYQCSSGPLRLGLYESYNRFQNIRTQKIDLFLNDTKISTVDYSEDNIGFTQTIVHTGKCIPLIVKEDGGKIGGLADCISQIVNTGELKKMGDFEICSLSSYIEVHDDE